MGLFNKKTTEASAKRKILASATTMVELRATLGLANKPRKDWKTVEPVEGGYYLCKNVLYTYEDGALKQVTE